MNLKYYTEQKTTITKETIVYNFSYVKLKMSKTKPRKSLLFERKMGTVIGIVRYGKVFFLYLRNGYKNMFTL